MSNSYYDGSLSENYLSRLMHEDVKYCDFNILQLIKANGKSTKSKDNLSSLMLFSDGALNNEFSMSKTAKQFVNEGKLNSGLDLGFSFKVNALNSTYASIEVTKL